LGIGFTVVLALALLFADHGSAVFELTLAVLLFTPELVAEATSCMLTVPALAISPRVHVTTWTVCPQLP